MRPVTYWIDRLGLTPHPEGGYYAETYRSAETIAGQHLPGRYKGGRAMATGIYFLVEGGRFSALHRICSDEMWHFYAGTSITVHSIDAQGVLHTHRLGADADAGQVFQATVPAGHWFGSRVPDVEGYALVGCTVAPGFDFTDFELARRDQLLAQFPQHRGVIEQLTHC